ncbi:MAG: hypothetical protein RLZZ373_3243 [Pseudomonadota bacterium]|jgi:hypothetical protein
MIGIGKKFGAMLVSMAAGIGAWVSSAGEPVSLPSMGGGDNPWRKSRRTGRGTHKQVRRKLVKGRPRVHH